MELDRAIAIVCRVHTREHHGFGWQIDVGASAAWHNGVSHADWCEAWKTLRQHCHLPVEVGQYPVADSPGEPLLDTVLGPGASKIITGGE